MNLLNNQSSKMFVAGCIGFVSTIAATVYSVNHFHLKIDEISQKNGAVTKKDKVKRAAIESVIPTVLAGITLYSFGKARSIDSKAIANLTLKCGVLGGAYNSLMASVSNNVDEAQAAQIFQQAKQIDTDVTRTEIGLSSPDLYLCEDDWTHTMFYSNMDNIESAATGLLRILNYEHRPISLIDIWSSLGILSQISEDQKAAGMDYVIEPSASYAYDSDDIFGIEPGVDYLHRKPKLIVTYEVKKSKGVTQYGY